MCASALRYDVAQLQAWWNASDAGMERYETEDACPPEDACRRPAAPARVALLLRGESFRASPAQHTRDTCTERSLWAQARVTATHYRLVEWMEGLGFGVDVYGLTRPCHGGERHLAERAAQNKNRTNVRYAVQLGSKLIETEPEHASRTQLAVSKSPVVT